MIDSKGRKVRIFYPNSPPQTKSNDDSLADDLLPNLTLTPQRFLLILVYFNY